VVPPRRSRTLVISVLPVPDGGSAPVTSLGMRAWGLAQGLRSHGHDVAVLVLSDDVRAPFSHDGLQVLTEPHHPEWPEVLLGFEVVIVVYCSDAAHEITGVVEADVIVVLDLFAPWYVEAAARRSADPRSEYGPYLDDVTRWNEVLVRGDVFLCTNATQQHYYVGVLSALGGVNPFTYDNLNILEVPFGIDDRPVPAARALVNPYRSLGIPTESFVLLWFGAIYPWFNIHPVLEAVMALTAESHDLHFVVVGGQNPWVSDEVYGRGYAHARQVLGHLVGTQAHFVDWVSYDERMQWYAHAGVVVSLNTAGLENRYSWRTRLVDYVAAQQPVITNGGDPLGDQVLASGGGFHSANDAQELVEVVRRLRAQPALIVDARSALAQLRSRFAWGQTTKELALLLDTIDPPYANEDKFARSNHLPRRLSRPTGTEQVFLHAAHLLRRFREEGLHGMTAVLRDRTIPRLTTPGSRRRRDHGHTDRPKVQP